MNTYSEIPQDQKTPITGNTTTIRSGVEQRGWEGELSKEAGRGRTQRIEQRHFNFVVSIDHFLQIVIGVGRKFWSLGGLQDHFFALRSRESGNFFSLAWLVAPPRGVLSEKFGHRVIVYDPTSLVDAKLSSILVDKQWVNLEACKIRRFSVNTEFYSFYLDWWFW